MIQLVKNIQDLYQQKISFVLVTLFQIKGSAPQEVGAKMLVTERGLHWGTVGGGKIEAHCIQYAKELLKDRASSESQYWNLQKDIGMSCGGEVGLFFDVNQNSSWQISIFGAGHVSQEVCKILQAWSCQVSVFDTRADWLEKLPASPNIDQKLSSHLPDEVESLPAGSMLLCMTMGHAVDLPILKKAFKKFDSFSLIGVIGSEVKTLKIKKELSEFGINDEQLQQLASPIGLPIGDSTPCEMAVSICSLLLAKRDHKSFVVKDGNLYR